jgi:NhaA family Na+:H+ antiporter
MVGILRNFLARKSAPGILLCVATFLAILFENSFLEPFYDEFKNLPVIFKFGDFVIDKSLLLWINDGLMAIFFLLIGLEIKREILEGHLSSRDQIVLPAIAAFGGLVCPALIYTYINWNNPQTIDGWAIPAATDIAFALGVMIILGDRVPASLKVCLVAIAIIDDLAAIIIIALFYTAETSILSLTLAFIGLCLAFAMNRRGVTKLGPYMVLGLFIWACVLKSGVHATLAGVALGLIIPLKAKDETGHSPLIKLEHALHPWVALMIVPIFAFSNAGISFEGLGWDTFTHPITLGIMAGLFIGKQFGVMAFTYIASMLKLCRLPEGVSWLQFYGLALLTGIGFTMSLFIGTLAFTDPYLLYSVRFGVLAGSLLSGVLGVSVLLYASRKNKPTVETEIRPETST